MSAARATTSGYTLIELLVVIALIAVLTAAIGLGLRGANEASALQATQGIVRAQLDSARARALLNGRPTALALFADQNDPDRFLRELGLAELNESGEWHLVTDGIVMPGDVRMLSPGDGGTLWVGPLAVGWDPGGEAIAAYVVRFLPDGSMAELGGGALRWAVEGASVPDGIVVSRYGAVVAETNVTEAEVGP